MQTRIFFQPEIPHLGVLGEAPGQKTAEARSGQQSPWASTRNFLKVGGGNMVGGPFRQEAQNLIRGVIRA